MYNLVRFWILINIHRRNMANDDVNECACVLIHRCRFTIKTASYTAFGVSYHANRFSLCCQRQKKKNESTIQLSALFECSCVSKDWNSMNIQNNNTNRHNQNHIIWWCECVTWLACCRRRPDWNKWYVNRHTGSYRIKKCWKCIVCRRRFYGI